MKSANININDWESCAEDHSTWHLAVSQGVQKAKQAGNTNRCKESQEEGETIATTSIVLYLQQVQ